MLTSASLGVALLIFAVGLFVQSATLVRPEERLPSLGRRLQRVGGALLVPGVALLVPGHLVTKLYDSYVSMGCALLIVGVNLVVQGVCLARRTNKEALGRLLRIWSFIGLAAGSGLLLALVVIALL